MIGSSNYWQFKLDKATVTPNKTTTVTVCEKGCNAIINTGQTYSYGPKAQVDKLNTALGGESVEGLYYFDCNRVKRLKNIIFTIAGQNFEMTPSDYLLKYNQQCISPLRASSGSQKDNWLFGLDFLRTVYTVFDGKNKRIGFAKPVNS